MHRERILKTLLCRCKEGYLKWENRSSNGRMHGVGSCDLPEDRRQPTGHTVQQKYLSCALNKQKTKLANRHTASLKGKGSILPCFSEDVTFPTTTSEVLGLVSKLEAPSQMACVLYARKCLVTLISCQCFF